MTPDIVIRQMVEADIDKIVETFEVWHKYRPQYERYYAQQQQGARLVLVALHGEKVVGYGNIVWKTDYPPFVEADVPEIGDLNVITAYQKRGIGSAIIREAERIVAATGRQVIGIGVEQTPDYDAPNRLYPKLGFVPNGLGLFNNTLMLIKQLSEIAPGD